MKKNYALLALLLLLTAVAKADDTKLQAEVPVTDNWMYFMPDYPPYITVNLTNPTDAEATAHVVLQVTTDPAWEVDPSVDNSSPLWTVEKTKTVPAKGSTEAGLEFEAQPGFYRCTVFVNDEEVRSFRIGVDPEDVKAAPDYQPDFQEFWAKAKEDLAKIEPQYKMTELPEQSTPERKVYLVEMHSLSDGTDTEGDGVIIRGYYAEPTGEGTYPVMVIYEGYDMENDDPYILTGDSKPDFCQFLLSPRGQLVNNRPPFNDNPYGKWLVYGLDHQDHYYYRGAMMDAIRAIDFVCSRDKVQKENIFVDGMSQGGALAFAAAALDDRVNAITPAVPFLGDFPNYLHMDTWPSRLLIEKKTELGMSEEELLKVLSYFDTKNLATMVKCPVSMYFSLQDATCPPATNFAPYNNLTVIDKTYNVGPEEGHGTPAFWTVSKYLFYNNHMKEPTAINNAKAGAAADAEAVYSLQGVRMEGKALKKGVYLKDGRKFIKK